MALFRSPRASGPRLGCFGKLPSYGDFISLHQDSSDAQAFVEWLQAAVTELPSAQVGAADQFLCFAFNPDGARRSLIGVLWQSEDSAGRAFPFALFVSVPGPTAVQEGAYQAFAVSQVWGQLYELFSRVRVLTSYREQYALLQSAVPVDVPTVESAAAAFPSCLPRGVLTAAHPGEIALQVRDVKQLADELGRSPETPEFAVWLRIYQAHDAALEASVWAQMLFAWLAEPKASSLFLRICPSADDRGAFFCRRDLYAADLGFLLAPSAEYRYATYVGDRDIPSDEHEERFLHAFVRRWRASSQTCRDLLALGTRQWSTADLAFDPLLAEPVAPSEASAGGGEVPALLGEMEFVEEVETDPPTGPLAQDDGAITGPVTCGPVATSSDDEAPTGPQEVTPSLGVAGDALCDQIDHLLGSLRRLVRRPLVAGRIVQVETAADAPSGTAPTRLFVPDGEGAVHPLGADSADLDRRVGEYRRARQDLTSLASTHRALEALLERLLADATKTGRSRSVEP